MARKPKFDPTGRAAKLFAALLALCVWQLAAALIHNRLLLVGPVQVARRVIGLLGEKTTREALGFTFGRISPGFFLAFLAALVLAALSARFLWVETLLRPYILAIQTVPVASFIVIALLWLSSRRISAFIAFLMVLPVLYANALQGIREADPQLLEMARVFRLSGLRRVRCIWNLPAMWPWACAGRREWRQKLWLLPTVPWGECCTMPRCIWKSVTCSPGRCCWWPSAFCLKRHFCGCWIFA